MIQEINEDTYIIWSDEEPSAVVMERYRDRIMFIQQSDTIDIDMDMFEQIIKLYKKIKNDSKV